MSSLVSRDFYNQLISKEQIPVLIWHSFSMTFFLVYLLSIYTDQNTEDLSYHNNIFNCIFKAFLMVFNKKSEFFLNQGTNTHFKKSKAVGTTRREIQVSGDRE